MKKNVVFKLKLQLSLEIVLCKRSVPQEFISLSELLRLMLLAARNKLPTVNKI